jgi:hypothetical protein
VMVGDWIGGAIEEQQSYWVLLDGGEAYVPSMLSSRSIQLDSFEGGCTPISAGRVLSFLTSVSSLVLWLSRHAAPV